jgi:2'-5' RNA ligase
MKLKDIKSDRGTYSAVRFSKESEDALIEYAKLINVPNPLDRKKLHVTLLYSRRYCPDYKPQGELVTPYLATVKGADVFNTRTPDDVKRCLVLKLESLDLFNRHLELMNEHSATYDFLSYIPHVTLSYDIGDDFDVLTLPKFEGELEIVEEYGEDLEFDSYE